jgi:hypothetical protein
MQLGKVDCITSVGFDPLAWLARDQRRSVSAGRIIPTCAG